MPHSIHHKRLVPPVAQLLISAALLSVALALAGCGGSSSPTVAQLSSTKSASHATPEGGGASPESTTSHQQKEVDYAKCLRSHGVPDVPEPRDGFRIVNGRGGGGPNPGPPQFHAAQEACNNLLPSGGTPSPQMRQQVVAHALQFSACMRSHGEPNFPDPSGGGGAMRIGGPGSSLDPKSPQFKAAQKACQQYFGPPGSSGAP